MIKMGEIACRIPSNGVKPEILYCTEPEGYKLDHWNATSSAIIALFTVILCLVAIGALIVARRTLNQMRDDSEKQWKSVEEQLEAQGELTRGTIEADRQLARDQHQTELLITHLQAVRTMQIRAGDVDVDMTESYSDVSITWAAWSMFLDEDDEMTTLTQQYSDDVVTVTKYVHGLIGLVRAGELADESIQESVDGWGEIVAKYIANLLKWQAFPDKRATKVENIRWNLNYMRVGFNSLFDKGAKVG